MNKEPSCGHCNFSNQDNKEVIQQDRGVGRWGVLLSRDHQEYIFRCKESHGATAESGQESLNTGKEYIDPRKTRQDEGRKGKSGGEWVRLDQHPGRWRNWSRGEIPTLEQYFGTEGRRVRLLESEAADLWWSEGSENHTDNPYHRPTYAAGILVLQCMRWLGAEVQGLENSPRVRTAIVSREAAWGDEREEITGRSALGGNHCWVPHGGWGHRYSLSPHMPALAADQ